MDRLSSFDTSFLINERRGAHMAIGAVLTCAGEAPSLAEFSAHVASRLHLLPRLRQRLATAPLHLGTPYWVDDPDFELARHVGRATLPAPAGEAQFGELIGTVFAPPLDRARPLWELWLVDGFESERFAVLYKTHHALADGISAVDIGTLLFDIDPRYELSTDIWAWRPRPLPTRGELAGRTVVGLGSSFARALHWLARTLRQPARAGRRAADGAAGLWEVSWALMKPAPKLPLNTALSAERSFASSSHSLADFKLVKEALGGTVNDVCLAVCAGALGRWLDDRGVATAGLVIQALVPVSIRAPDEHGGLGNKLTAMRGPLPVGVADPVERLHAISASMQALKASKQPLGAEAIWALNDWFRDFAPPLLLAPTAAINFSTRLFNLLLTNFPGPQIPLYVLGRELSGVFPVGFLAHRHALAIAIISYNDQVNFGLLADPTAIGDLERLNGYIGAAFEDLLAAAVKSGSLAPEPKTS